MVLARSWYATLIGKFTTGTWAGEMAQLGFRGTATDSGGFFTPVIGAPLGEFNVAETGDVDETADYQIQYGFRGTSVMTEAHQRSIADALRTYANAIRTGQKASNFNWVEVRVAALKPNHDYVNGASIFTFKAPVSGQGSVENPPQLACVASLRSGGRTGRHRGRVYIPCNGATFGSGGLVGLTMRDAFGNGTVALARALDGIDPNIYPGIVSLTTDTWSSITSVRVNDVVDTQRRRSYERTATESVYDV